MARAESSDDDHLKLGDFLCFAIYAAGHAFNRLYKPLLEPLGLTYPQFRVRVALWEEDGQTVGELGDKLTLESSTLTPLLKRMESQGLVARRRDPADERQVRISLTDQGRALKEQARTIPACLFEQSGMKVEDVIRLQREITALRQAMSEAGG